ncbi:MAG: SoxR reducing system RseC family protein [Mariprofundaceae bacterium]|nr:SoxR reducing system RseC family protein [Mariprofundaceae bacterium]
MPSKYAKLSPMRQTVYVAEIHGDEVLVVSERASSCGGCAGKASCNTLGSWKEGSGKGRILSLRIQNTLKARINDEVIIEVADDLLLKTAFRLYAMPMIFFIMAGGLVWFQTHSDVMASITGMVTVVMYYGWIWQQGTPEGFDVTMVQVN